MPKTATKAADNVFYKARMEAAKFNDRLASREGASEELGLDRTRLARIELGSLTPYPEEVLIMGDAYHAPQLLNTYCSTCCPIGKDTIPHCELLQIDRLTIKILSAMQSTEFVHDEIIAIAKDGRITEDEVPQLKQIMNSLRALERASMELRLFIKKNIP